MKTTLFDIGEEKKATMRRPQPQPQPAGECQEFNPSVAVECAASEPVGRIDDVYSCADSSCGASCLDIIAEHGREWYVECAFCGTGQRVRAIPGHLKQEDVFVLRQGRFAGKTLSQVAREHHGMEYLIWAEKSHKSHTVREAVKTHLDAQKIAR